MGPKATTAGRPMAWGSKVISNGAIQNGPFGHPEMTGWVAPRTRGHNVVSTRSFGSRGAPNAATHKTATWLVFPRRLCAMAGLDGTTMAGGRTRGKVPTPAIVPARAKG